ncbi:hypothetical protein F4808DRAFT_354091 [Astrocystis sublimbata]|nr:hypothetical protein F4808DRAFT_354091 [Astrocystis sublimbata]
MSLGKWSFGSRTRSTASSGNSDTSTSSSSTRASSLFNNRSSGSNNSNNNKTSPASPTSSSSSSKRLSWFRSSSRPKRKSIISRDDPAFARLHKPFTAQNLEHQKMLSAFDWNFDDDSDHRRQRISLEISPCASRNATVDDYASGCDYGYGGREDEHNSHSHMLPLNGRQSTLGGFSMRRG